MNKFTKLAFPAMGMILVGASSLVTATYAWFTTGKSASVDTISLNVQSAEGLLLAWGTDDTASVKWTSTLHLEDADAESQESAWDSSKELKPVSTTGTVANGKPTFAAGDVDTSDSKYVYISRAAESSYVKFSIMMKNESTSTQNIKLQNDDGNSPIPTTVTSLSGQNPNYSELAARIGFVNRGYKEAGKNRTTIDNSNMVIFEPNSGTHIPGVTANTTLAVKPEATADSLITLNDNKGIRIDQITGKTAEGGEVYLEQQTTITSTSATAFTLEPSAIKYLDIYIWIEGQDADCVNYISGHGIAATLNFGMSKLS